MTAVDLEAAYVFGYGSLVTMREPLPSCGGASLAPVAGRLLEFQRFWGVAMNNWEAAPAKKHYVDPASRLTPRIRVAFLDVEAAQGRTVNGLAVPVDAARLAAMDLREVNYSRIDVSSQFEPSLDQPVFVYRGTVPARERCRVPPHDPELVVSQDYLDAVRLGFDTLGSGCLDEFDQSTPPCPFPLRRLSLVRPDHAAEGAPPQR